MTYSVAELLEAFQKATIITGSATVAALALNHLVESVTHRPHFLSFPRRPNEAKKRKSSPRPKL